MKRNEFKPEHVGKTVRWKSQAAGRYKIKEGKVVYVFESSKERPSFIAERFYDHKVMFDGTWGDCTGRALVSVPHPGKGKPRLYLPAAADIRIVD